MFFVSVNSTPTPGLYPGCTDCLQKRKANLDSKDFNSEQILMIYTSKDGNNSGIAK